MSESKTIAIVNKSNTSIVCSAKLADTFGLRLRGLLGQRELDPQSGLLITPSSGVHTFGMSFSIDVVALDRDLKVIGVWEAVGPWNVCGLSFQTHHVLELSSGRARQCGVCVGDQLLLQPGPALQMA